MTAPDAAVPGEFARRAATSLAVLLAVTFCGRVLLPGLNPSVVESFAESARRSGGTASLGVFALALYPFLSAFMVVELAALLVPAWRPLRTGGPGGRTRLRSAAVTLGVIFACVQAVGLHQFYDGLTRGGMPVFTGEFAPSGPVLLLLLVGGTLSLHLLTVLVDKAGLGHGYAIVLLGLSLDPALRLVGMLLHLVSEEVTSPLAFLVLMLGVGGIVRGTVRLLRGRLPKDQAGSGQPQALPLPTSGLAPLTYAASLMALFTQGRLLGLIPLGEASRALEVSSAGSLLVLFVLTALFTVGFSVLFHRPQRVGAVWAARTAQAPAEHPDIQGRVAQRIRALLPSAIAWSLVLTTLAWLPSRLATLALGIRLPEAGALLLGVAIVLDLRDEARMRRTGRWVGVWPVHRVYEVEPALAALSAAGIPAWARGGFARAMLQFFGPYFPIELMVPATRAAEAHALLERAHAQESR